MRAVNLERYVLATILRVRIRRALGLRSWLEW